MIAISTFINPSKKLKVLGNINIIIPLMRGLIMESDASSPAVVVEVVMLMMIMIRSFCTHSLAHTAGVVGWCGGAGGGYKRTLLLWCVFTLFCLLPYYILYSV